LGLVQFMQYGMTRPVGMISVHVKEP
jgi:hypothetical protein